MATMNAACRSAAIAVAAFVACAAAGAAANAQQSLTIVSFGGAYTKGQVAAMFDPFTKATGIKVNTEDYDGGLAKIRAMTEAKNVTWDVMDMEVQDADLACNEGLIMPLPKSVEVPGADGTPAAKDFIPGGLMKCGIGNNVWSNVIAFDSSKFPKDRQPKSVADFFDLKKFPGKRGLNKRPNSVLEWALMADGVPLDKIYEVLSTPAGVDRAFKKLDTIKSSAVFWDAGAQPPQMLVDGSVTMTTAYSGRIFNAAKETKKPFVVIWNGQIWNMDVFAIPAGTKHKEAALKMVAFISGSKPLADLTKYIPYGPMRKSSMPFVEKSVLPNLPTSPANFKHALQAGYKWWADHSDEMNERYAAWLAK